MARHPRLFAPGLLYHVIVRGNQRQKTFLTDRDYQAYLERLANYRKAYKVRVHAIRRRSAFFSAAFRNEWRDQGLKEACERLSQIV